MFRSSTCMLVSCCHTATSWDPSHCTTQANFRRCPALCPADWCARVRDSAHDGDADGDDGGAATAHLSDEVSGSLCCAGAGRAARSYPFPTERLCCYCYCCAMMRCCCCYYCPANFGVNHLCFAPRNHCTTLTILS